MCAYEDQIMIDGKKDMSSKQNCLYLIPICVEPYNTVSFSEEKLDC
jgi:hypothetical protein